MTKHDKEFRNTELNTFVQKDRAELKMENTTEVNTEIKMQKKIKIKDKNQNQKMNTLINNM